MDKIFGINVLRNIKGVGKSAFYKKYFEALKNIDSIEKLKSLILKNESRITSLDVEEAVRIAEALCDGYKRFTDIKIITVYDKEYPQRLNVMGNKRPQVLYVKGNLEALNKDNIAVIGTRTPSELSKREEERLVSGILQHSDRVVVSGLALGCDSIAHKTVVNDNRITIAVLPCGVNNIVPASNRKLAEDILKSNGCLVSEYEPNAAATKYMFVERDEIVAALSDITFVVECGMNSGTMHTARAALEFCRKLACFYPNGDVDGQFAGNEYLIDGKQAYKVIGIDDLIKLLNEKPLARTKESEDLEERQMTIEEWLIHGHNCVSDQ